MEHVRKNEKLNSFFKLIMKPALLSSVCFYLFPYSLVYICYVFVYGHVYDSW